MEMFQLLFSALEPRLMTRFDCRRFAREAYDAGVRYFGGCCGFEPYHIREVAEEVSCSFEKENISSIQCNSSRHI